jgi:hypothetical protein
MRSIGQTWVLTSIGGVVEMGVVSTLERLRESSRQPAYNNLCWPQVESDEAQAVDRTHVPNLHIIMRRRLLGRMMAVTLLQRHQSLFGESIWGFPCITEISVRKFKIRLISEVVVNSV